MLGRGTWNRTLLIKKRLIAESHLYLGLALKLQALELLFKKTLSRGAVPVFVLSHSKLSSLHAF